jgi:hypothetical protein
VRGRRRHHLPADAPTGAHGLNIAPSTIVKNKRMNELLNYLMLARGGGGGGGAFGIVFIVIILICFMALCRPESKEK